MDNTSQKGLCNGSGHNGLPAIYRRYVMALVLLCALVPSCQKGSEQEQKEIDADKVVVRVGTSTITVAEYRSAMRSLLPQGEGAVTAMELRELKKNLINQLVEEELLIQEARNRGLVVSEGELTVELGALKGSSGEEEFTKAITRRYGGIRLWKEEVRKNLLVKKATDVILSSEIEVGDEEARAYYEKNKVEYEVSAQVRARMIVLESEKKAREVRKRLKRENFEAVAMEVSVGPEAHLGGDLGYFARGDMPPEFEEVVFELKKGRISEILKTQYGYHIFKVEDKKTGRKLKYEDVKESIVEEIKRAKADERFRELLVSLKKKVEIDVDRDLL